MSPRDLLIIAFLKLSAMMKAARETELGQAENEGPRTVYRCLVGKDVFCLWRSR